MKGKKKEEKWKKRKKREEEGKMEERKPKVKEDARLWSWWKWCKERTKWNIDKGSEKVKERRRRRKKDKGEKRVERGENGKMDVRHLDGDAKCWGG